MSYIASLLTDDWRDGLMHECVAYRLISDGAGSLQIARNGHEGVENVGVELQVHMIKYGAQVTALLNYDDTPFFVMAVCKSDPLAPPVALDLYVNAVVFERDMQRVGTVPGEHAVVDMLAVAARCNLLIKRVVSTPGATSDRAVSKRARTAAPEPHQTTAELLHRLITQEHSHAHAGMPLFLTVPGSQYVFCLKEFAFVPQSYGAYESLQLNGGVVVGDRGADKTELVKQLIERTRSESASARRTAPPFLRPVKATLLIVPTALVDQWYAALAPTCRVVVVLNKRMLQQCATFAAVHACDVVIVTHMFYLTFMRKATSKHKARVCARAPLSEIAHQYCRLDWVFWKRIVFDEALHFYMCSRKGKHGFARGKMLWLLQGGVEVTSFDACALVDFLLQHTHLTRSCFLNVSALALDCLVRATSLQGKNEVQVETVCTSLTEVEQRAYTVLQEALSSPEELLQVAAGDLSPMKKFMHPVVSWNAAIPLGATILTSYIESVADVEFVWSDGDDNEEDNEDGDMQSAAADVSSDAVEVQLDASGNAAGNTSEGDAGSDGVPPLRQQLDELLDDMVGETTDEMQDRLEFFKRAGSELESGAMEAACCSVCLSSTSDCLFVCGHMLCHACVVHLFINSKKKEIQELGRQGLVASNEGFFAQCPQCRWELEPHEVFWNTGVLVPNRKQARLATLLHELTSRNESVLVLGTVPDVLLTVLQGMCDRDLPCKALTYSPVSCRQALSWFKASPGRVLFMFVDQLNGLKLPFVSHVVLLHPHVQGRVHQDLVHTAILDCVNNGSKNRTVHVHQLLANHTLEGAIIE